MLGKLAVKNKLPIGVLASGNGTNLQALIDFSKRPDCLFKIACVIANINTAKALERAQEAGISNYIIEHAKFSKKSLFELEIIKHLKKHDVNLVVLAGFMRILGHTFLQEYLGKTINIHPSLLPKYPGLNAVEQALLAKEEYLGCTVHFVNKNVDDGDIIAQSSRAVKSGIGLDSAKTKVHELEHKLLPKVLNMLAGKNIYMATKSSPTNYCASKS